MSALIFMNIMIYELNFDERFCLISYPFSEGLV